MSSYLLFIPTILLTPHRRPVYEYPLNGQWIMMDIDDGYILWTGIWKGALYQYFESLAFANHVIYLQRSEILKVPLIYCAREAVLTLGRNS